MTDQRTAWGWGLASVDAAGNTLDVWYPELKLGEAPEEVARPNHNFDNLAHEGADARGVRRIPVFTVSKLDRANRRCRRRLPASALAEHASGQAEHTEPGRYFRGPQQCGVDQLWTVRGRGFRSAQARCDGRCQPERSGLAECRT